MKKDLGAHPYLFPIPVLMVATYGEDGVVDVMNVGWGGACSMNQILLHLSKGHKTSENIRNKKAFTISIADLEHAKEADFFGIASGNTMNDKFERSGLHAVKSEKVDAPIIEEFPVTLECKVLDIDESGEGMDIKGEILSVLVEEKYFDENGQVDIKKVNPIILDPFSRSYFTTGENIGSAWGIGKELAK